MPKPVLGRDLGTLLGRSPQKNGMPKAPAQSPAEVGLKSLIRGTRPETQPNTAAAPSVPAAPSPIPRWYLFAGDILLVAMALLTAWASPHPLSWPRLVFCGGAIALAAILGLLAIQSRAGAGVVPDGKAPEQFRNHQAGRRHPDQQ